MTTKIYSSTEQMITTTHVAAADIAAGDIVKLGGTTNAILAVAIDNIASGATGVVAFNCGVVAPKVTAAVFAKGESLTWDVSAGKFDDNQATPAAGDVSGAAARADAAGTSSDTTCRVWLTGIPSALQA